MNKAKRAAVIAGNWKMNMTPSEAKAAVAKTAELEQIYSSILSNGRAEAEKMIADAKEKTKAVMAAAEEAGAKVIGVDVDQSSESDTVITSAMKMLSNSVYDGVKAFYDGSFPGGQTSVFTAENDGVGLPMETSKFESFTQTDYDALFADMKAGKITINNNTEDSTTADLTLSNTKVSFVE